MFVIGTAGHVDHGKSTLIKALTGIHPDRLKEEQIREMTIDLGFAWLTLPNKEEIGIIDVPGHRDFIENMLAGVGGIDAALLVIAADEGVMPQTKEHLAILDLLQIKNGIIVISKIDLVEDEDWLDLVELDIRDAVKGTIFSEAPLVRVSAYTKVGIDNLISTIQELLSNVEPKPDFNRARLSIDRVFSLSGFGTIVTGTLIDGILKVGEEVELLPDGLRARIRGLQTHKKKEEIAFPGSRTAVNISGVDMSDVRRGQVLASLNKYQPTKRFDAHIKLVVDSSFSVKHNQEIKLFIGSSEVLSRVRVLGKDEIKPGEEGWVQIEPVSPVVAIRGDRFIIRIPSPGETIGGGRIVNPQPQRRHKRFSQDVLNQLAAYAQGSPKDIFLQAVREEGIGSMEHFSRKAKLELEIIQQFFSELIDQKQLFQLEKGEIFKKTKLIICSDNWLNLQKNKVLKILDEYHHQFNLRPGIPKEELKSKLSLDQNIFQSLLANFDELGIIKASENMIRLSEFSTEASSVQEKNIQKLINLFQENPYITPNIKDCIQEYGLEIVNYLQYSGELIAVNSEVAFLKDHYQKMVDWVINKIENTGSLTAAEFRDQFETSRKYALAFLEHLDLKGVTVREGDVRRLRDQFR